MHGGLYKWTVIVSFLALVDFLMQVTLPRGMPCLDCCWSTSSYLKVGWMTR